VQKRKHASSGEPKSIFRLVRLNKPVDLSHIAPHLFPGALS